MKNIILMLILLQLSCSEKKENANILDSSVIQNNVKQAILKDEPNKRFEYNPNQKLIEEIAFDELIWKYNDFDINQNSKINNGITGKAIINASNKLLKAEDIENLYKGDLEVIRNTIFARHGYIFKSKKMKYLFEELVVWYQPISDNVGNEITKIEQKNIDLIKRYEENAEKYEISFAR